MSTNCQDLKSMIPQLVLATSISLEIEKDLREIFYRSRTFPVRASPSLPIMAADPIHRYERLIARQRFLLRLIGIDSYDPHFRIHLLTAGVVFLATLFLVISLYDLYHFRADRFNFVFVLITIFFATIGIARISVHLCYRGLLSTLLEETYRTYRAVRLSDTRQQRILHWYTRLFERAVLLYSATFMGTAVIGAFLPLGIYLATGERVLPYGVVIPYVNETSRQGYAMNYAYQVSCIVWTPPGLIASECMMFALVLNICIQYDLLAVQLLDLDELIRRPKEDGTRSRLIARQLRNIVRDQQRLMRFIGNIEQSHTIMSGVEVLSLGMQIVITLFVVQLSLWLPGLALIPTFSLQLFLFCLLGTVIEHKGDTFADAVYSVAWHQLSPADQRIFRLLLLVSQQPKTLTCGRTTRVSLKLFVNMSQKFYSIFMMLRSF
uniref:Odorant receptor n=1 Tax=Anopheles farauti TaxID=69004 RepID=A0A182QK48_9DIPT